MVWRNPRLPVLLSTLKAEALKSMARARMTCVIEIAILGARKSEQGDKERGQKSVSRDPEERGGTRGTARDLGTERQVRGAGCRHANARCVAVCRQAHDEVKFENTFIKMNYLYERYKI